MDELIQPWGTALISKFGNRLLFGFLARNVGSFKGRKKRLTGDSESDQTYESNWLMEGLSCSFARDREKEDIETKTLLGG